MEVNQRQLYYCAQAAWIVPKTIGDGLPYLGTHGGIPDHRMPSEARDFIQVPSDRSSRPMAATIERPGEPPHAPEVARRVIDLPDHRLAIAHHLDRRTPCFEIQHEVQIAETHNLIVAVKPT